MKVFHAVIEFALDENIGWDGQLTNPDLVGPALAKWIEGLNDREKHSGEYIHVMAISEQPDKEALEPIEIPAEIIDEKGETNGQVSAM